MNRLELKILFTVCTTLILILMSHGIARAQETGTAGQTEKYYIHVIVALCDNENQGIKPVSPRLGDGNDARNNLYWDAKYGVKSFLRNNGWNLATTILTPEENILERSVFEYSEGGAVLVADAYRGREIKQAVKDFLESASGRLGKSYIMPEEDRDIEFKTGGSADLLVYVGHNGLMDFSLDKYPEAADDIERDAMVLACFSREFFEKHLLKAGARPVLLTEGLIAPEAYTLKAALDAWLAGDSFVKISEAAALEYNRYQNVGTSAARRLFGVAGSTD